MRLQWIAMGLALLGGTLLTGCVSDGSTTSASNAFASADTSTVAFESVDGPPPQIFDRLVTVLDSEAKLRGIPVVSREGDSTYRVRTYLAAQVRGAKTAIAWTWDVYDRNQQRALRLTGEEAAGRGGRDAWAAADDAVIRRIAQAGLTGLAGLLRNGPMAPFPSAPAVPAGESGPATADANPARSVPAAIGFRQD